MKNIWVNGCFDILHIGHTRLLKYAKSLGDRLYVGIDSDDRIRELKGPERPFNSQDDRKEFLLSVSYVDDVIIYNTDDELSLSIKNSYADFIVVGEEYRNKNVVGSEHAQVIYFPRIDGYSTTRILNDH